eukprot:TRINITY_DN9109_c1_g1_i1.p1 TRINITY_DN9109_c1_g1~~TRINITY_DN9109_c1_g1_i1.p1  ORF type:complete len:597 (+),score=72.12 TRINITY_DN9109_c1_g1_i1:43-1833(+)
MSGFQPIAPSQTRSAILSPGGSTVQIHKDYCVTPRDGGWFDLYQVPAKGERSVQEFEELTLRRIEMLAALQQEEGLERMEKAELIKEISAASKGEKTKYSKGIFEWVSQIDLDSRLFKEETELRETHKIQLSDIYHHRTSNRIIDLGDKSNKVSAYLKELPVMKANVTNAMYERAFVDDSISHWACRLAFCGEHKWREWFTRHEETLFKGRVHALSISDQQALLKKHCDLSPCEIQPDWIVPLAKMISQYSYNLRKTAQHAPEEVVRGTTIYSVPWEMVPFLVRERRVYVTNGIALTTHTQALTLLFDKFKTELETGLKQCIKARPDIDTKEKDRISAFLNKAVFQSASILEKPRDAKSTNELLDIEDIAPHARMHMPPCMRRMDQFLRSERHLKFDGRFQYMTFLKEAGLTLENAMKFFSEHMTFKTTPAKFSKSEYGYSIRYNYGSEGKKTNYRAPNCSTIIMGSQPRSGQCHGCPFRHLPETQLKSFVREARPYPVPKNSDTKTMLLHKTVQVSEEQVSEILKKSHSGHYSAACRSYFAATHPGYPKESSLFKSPNAYYSMSLQWAEEKELARGGGKPANQGTDPPPPVRIGQ